MRHIGNYPGPATPVPLSYWRHDNNRQPTLFPPPTCPANRGHLLPNLILVNWFLLYIFISNLLKNINTLTANVLVALNTKFASKAPAFFSCGVTGVGSSEQQIEMNYWGGCTAERVSWEGSQQVGAGEPNGEGEELLEDWLQISIQK